MVLGSHDYQLTKIIMDNNENTKPEGVTEEVSPDMNPETPSNDGAETVSPEENPVI